ncbi:hypothetical protein QR680_013243 [Steinernema hermaphroditum]|uniref:ribonuclease H n=1 Tax=Steinernema hermaphroditum TaxID=289476 RepID=A0AA39I754_9BILA|nr:hypothetical protein QR680_013243 [Steinernema hermaphroditum]
MKVPSPDPWLSARCALRGFFERLQCFSAPIICIFWLVSGAEDRLRRAESAERPRECSNPGSGAVNNTTTADQSHSPHSGSPGMSFYGVAHGFKRGVFESWDEAQAQIKGFPQPVYKKFSSRGDAEEYVKKRTPESVSLDDFDEDADKFYAVARGKVVGVFSDYDKVKNSIADFPQALHKKFGTAAEARAYYEKFAKGKEGEKEAEEEPEGEKKKSPPPKGQKEEAAAFYAVAKGHKTGVFATWAECKQQTDGFKGAKFKKFDNEEDAKLFAEGKTLKQIEERKRKASTSEKKEEVVLKRSKRLAAK